MKHQKKKHRCMNTWWLIPLSKWVITPVISGLTLLIPFISGVITHLLSGMSHQVVKIISYIHHSAMALSAQIGCYEGVTTGPAPPLAGLVTSEVDSVGKKAYERPQLLSYIWVK